MDFLAIYEFVINSDRKTISQRLLSYYPVWRSYSTIFYPQKSCKHPKRSLFIAVYGLLFQIHLKINQDILDWLNKPKIVRSYIFPIANLYFELSVDYRALIKSSQRSDSIVYLFS